MFRLSLYVIGVSAMVAAWAAYRNQQKRKPDSCPKAASMLQEAWADPDTRLTDAHTDTYAFAVTNRADACVHTPAGPPAPSLAATPADTTSFPIPDNDRPRR